MALWKQRRRRDLEAPALPKGVALPHTPQVPRVLRPVAALWQRRPKDAYYVYTRRAGRVPWQARQAAGGVVTASGLVELPSPASSAAGTRVVFPRGAWKAARGGGGTGRVLSPQEHRGFRRRWAQVQRRRRRDAWRKRRHALWRQTVEARRRGLPVAPLPAVEYVAKPRRRARTRTDVVSLWASRGGPRGSADVPTVPAEVGRRPTWEERPRSGALRRRRRRRAVGVRTLWRGLATVPPRPSPPAPPRASPRASPKASPKAPSKASSKAPSRVPSQPLKASQASTVSKTSQASPPLAVPALKPRRKVVASRRRDETSARVQALAASGWRLHRSGTWVHRDVVDGVAVAVRAVDASTWGGVPGQRWRRVQRGPPGSRRLCGCVPWSTWAAWLQQRRVAASLAASGFFRRVHRGDVFGRRSRLRSTSAADPWEGQRRRRRRWRRGDGGVARYDVRGVPSPRRRRRRGGCVWTRHRGRRRRAAQQRTP